jgi:beta-glucanase (GH16 family)
MRREWLERLGRLALSFASAACGGPAEAPLGWRLVWSDEFAAAAGAPPDPSVWNHDVGGDGWGNQELQYYTARADNAAHDGQGHLLITARREDWNGRGFTSARLTTRGKREQTYGRFEARMRLPTGRGLWPAFWLLGANLREAGWPGAGEIDVVEMRGAQPWRVTGAAHGPGYAGGNAVIAGYETPTRSDLTADFHTFAVEWEPAELRFYVDEHRYHVVRAARLPGGPGAWVFDHPFFLLLNVAVGGNFGGPPDASTVFPQTLVVDHVRVYEREQDRK